MKVRVDEIPWATPAPPTRKIVLTAASTIPVRPVRWFWDQRVALGTLVLLGGREGIGKSLVACTLAADCTRGRLAGAFAGEPRAVIVAATEDSWEHTLVPRFMAAGADLTRIYRVDVRPAESTPSGLALPRDLEELEQVIVQAGAALVVLDPLMSRLDTALDSHKDSEVRQALEPLVTLADRSGATVLGLIHVNKSSSPDALTMLMGSRAFAAVARAVLFAMVDPDDENARLLGQAKNNLGPPDLPSLGFTIAGEQVAETPEGPVWTGKLTWTGETDRSIREALEVSTAGPTHRTATAEAADWLQTYLAAHPGEQDSNQVRKDGAAAGHSKDALRRACAELNVVSRSAGFPRRAYWQLPGVRTPGASTTAHTAHTESTGATLLGMERSERTVGAVDAVGAVSRPVASLPPMGISPEAWQMHHQREVEP